MSEDEGFEFGPARRGRAAKVADRPHWITIVLGVLGPLVAAIAATAAVWSLMTAQRSVELSQMALKVSQRAYVISENIRVTLSGFQPYADPAAEGRYFVMEVRFDLRNVGRSTASKMEYAVEFPNMDGWIVRSPYTGQEIKGHTVSTISVSDLGPEGRITDRRARLTYHVGPVQLRQWADGVASMAPGMVQRTSFFLKLRYSDIFGDVHDESWCFASTMEGEVSECSYSYY